MIQFSLRCAEGHDFDSWFASGAAFETLRAQHQLSCAICGSDKVEKALMAPRVGGSDTPAPARKLAEPANPAEQALRALKAHVEKNATYVGRDFAREARDIHEGTKPERAIWGDVRPDDAKRLIEDGVPVAPLPFTPTRKTN